LNVSIAYLSVLYKRITYVKLGVLVKTRLQLLCCEALGEHSLPDSAHIQLASTFTSGGSTAVTHAADQVEDLRAG